MTSEVHRSVLQRSACISKMQTLFPVRTKSHAYKNTTDDPFALVILFFIYNIRISFFFFTFSWCV